MNITITVPPGTTTHNEANLLCIPPKWDDYLLFLLGNYVAHAITVVDFPGQRFGESVFAAIAALLLPVSGILRALAAIWSRAVFYRDPVTRAARARALCMVVKCDGRQDEGVIMAHFKVHGVYRLRPGWQLFVVPPGTPVSTPKPDKYAHCFLSTPYNAPKLCIGLAQAIWASVTLYRARGDQIDRYGYAAFGLTVAQYAYMSIINVIGNLVQPEYPATFMIRTPRMDEAERDGCYFSGELQVDLDKEKQDELTRLRPEDFNDVFLTAVGVFGWYFCLVPLAIVGGLSKFHAQESTSIQRGFTMSWLVVGIVYGPMVLGMFQKTGFLYPSSKRRWNLLFVTFMALIFVILFGVPFIGGMVVVMQMLREYGSCIRVS